MFRKYLAGRESRRCGCSHGAVRSSTGVKGTMKTKALAAGAGGAAVLVSPKMMIGRDHFRDITYPVIGSGVCGNPSADF